MASAAQKPKYREAYPRLDVLKAFAAHRRGRDICAYQDDRGRVLGVVKFTPLNDQTAAVLQGQLHGPNLSLWTDHVRIELLSSKNDPMDMRRVATCPGCERRVQSLVYVDFWGCAACHKLLYRRQLVDRPTLRAEDLVAAEERLKEMRPKGMHQRKYAERRAAAQATVDRIKPTITDAWHRVASAAHQAGVTGVWMSLGELRTNRTFSDYWTTFDEPRTVEDVGDS